jgi:ribosome-binding factor A
MMEVKLPDIVGGLSVARVFATIISEQQPDYAVPLKRVQEEAFRVQRELIEKIYPGSLSDED